MMDPKYVRFDIGTTINEVLNPKTLQYVRALRLFELEVSIIFCKGLADGRIDGESKFVIKAEKAPLLTARALGAVKILDLMRRKLCAGSVKQSRLLHLLGGDTKNAWALLDTIMFECDGLEDTLSPSVFDKRTKLAIKEVKAAADVLDFMLRFEKPQGSRKARCTTNMALDIVFGDKSDNDEARHYDLLRDRTTTEKAMRRLRPVNALIAVGFCNNSVLEPRRLNGSSIHFRHGLLSKWTRECFLRSLSHYSHARRILAERSIKCPEIELQHRLRARPMKVDPLPATILKLISGWRSHVSERKKRPSKVGR